jgi:folate-binding protein YgfZ
VPDLTERSARPALLLTPKGKLCAPLWVWKDSENLVLEVEESLRETVQDRLERYLISDDVELAQAPCETPMFHVFGATSAGSASLRISRTGAEGFDTTVPPSDLLEASVPELEALRIERGLPKWGAELDERTLPQEARLEVLAVDFDKGCYVGQEVVSRLRSVGHVNRRLFAFVGSLNGDPTPPLPLHLPGQLGEPVGVLTSWGQDLELAQTLALGYLNRAFAESPSFVATNPEGCEVGSFTKRPIPI